MARAGRRGLTDGRRLRRVARQVAAAIAFCHSRGVAHRDIKPENVLLMQAVSSHLDIHTKLCDFGAAAVSQQPPETTAAGALAAPPPMTCRNTVGSSQYCAPEIMEIYNAQKHSGMKAHKTSDSQSPASACYDPYAADVWSWAVTVYVLGSRKVPFKRADMADYRFRAFLAATQPEALEGVAPLTDVTTTQATYRWRWPRHFSAALVDLLGSCLRLVPSQRSTMVEVLSHPWMAGAGRSDTRSHTVQAALPSAAQACHSEGPPAVGPRSRRLCAAATDTPRAVTTTSVAHVPRPRDLPQRPACEWLADVQSGPDIMCAASSCVASPVRLPDCASPNRGSVVSTGSAAAWPALALPGSPLPKAVSADPPSSEPQTALVADSTCGSWAEGGSRSREPRTLSGGAVAGLAALALAATATGTERLDCGTQ